MQSERCSHRLYELRQSSQVPALLPRRVQGPRWRASLSSAAVWHHIQPQTQTDLWWEMQCSGDELHRGISRLTQLVQAACGVPLQCSHWHNYCLGFSIICPLWPAMAAVMLFWTRCICSLPQPPRISKGAWVIYLNIHVHRHLRKPRASIQGVWMGLVDVTKDLQQISPRREGQMRGRPSHIALGDYF